MNMVRKDGSTMNTLMTICPIRGENDHIVGASSIVRDITSEKREKHLREYEDRYRTLVEDLNVGIYRSTAEPEADLSGETRHFSIFSGITPCRISVKSTSWRSSQSQTEGWS